MNKPIFALAFFLTLMILSSSGLAEPVFRVLPNPLDRGTVARVVVEGLGPDTALTGSFDGRTIMFFSIGGQLTGFLGADVMLSPGRYPLTLTWPGGKSTLEVTVRDHSYGVRSIKVPQNQVDLSKADQNRAARERKAVNAVLGAVSPERLWRGAWTEPVNGRVNSSFGRQTRMNGVLNPRPHAGADYDVPEGTSVKVPADGVVLLADSHFFAGGSVYIDHGLGLISMYFHLSELMVKAGDPVHQGQVLGLSGATGRVTGAHLHYGLYLSRARIDPVAFHRLTANLPKE